MTAAKPSPKTKQPPTPKVGIFWVVRGKLILLGIPVSDGEEYGEHVNYGPSHYNKWRELQQSGAVPPECEYEEFPRGRVMFNKKTESFSFLVDACILGNKQILNRILREMNLPKAKTVIDRDSHYRCFRCLGCT